MTDQEIEEARLEIERDRLVLEKSKAKLENRFINRHSGVLIPAAVSLAAVIVSLGQIWVTKISKDRELEITSIQKKLELDLQDRQKEKELALLDTQKKREWDLSIARFVTENRKAIFNGTPDEQRLFAKIIPSIFPGDVSATLLDRIESASPPASKEVWQEARENIDQATSTGGPLKSISSFTYIGAPGTTVQIEVKPVGVGALFVAAIDGQILNGNPFSFTLNKAKVTFLLMEFNFPSNASDQAEYQIIIKGDGGGLFQTRVRKTDITHTREFTFRIE